MPTDLPERKSEAPENSGPIQWPLAAIWITLFVCGTAIMLAMILT